MCLDWACCPFMLPSRDRFLHSIGCLSTSSGNGLYWPTMLGTAPLYQAVVNLLLQRPIQGRALPPPRRVLGGR